MTGWHKLSNVEWLILIGLFTDRDILNAVRKTLKNIDTEHFLRRTRIIKPGDKVSSQEVAEEFRNLILPIIASVAASLNTSQIACIKYDVQPFSTGETRNLFNNLSIKEWRLFGKGLQDELTVSALITLFNHIEKGSDFKHLPNGFEKIIDVSRGYSENDLKIRFKKFIRSVTRKIRFW